MSQAPNILFFGCWNESGHRLWTRSRTSISEHQAKEWNFPSGKLLDGSPLLLPLPREDLHGCRTYLPSFHCTVLSWWNNIWDDRPGVNSHVILRGRSGTELIWDSFQMGFPELVKHHSMPAILNQY